MQREKRSCVCEPGVRRNVGVERSKAGEVRKEEVVQDLLVFVVNWLGSEKPHPKKPALLLLAWHWVVHW